MEEEEPYNAAGLEQVFDSNTDFSSKSESDMESTSVHAAFQICEVAAAASMSDSSCKTDLIPYEKALIKVLKEPKKSSRPFCGFQKRKRQEVLTPQQQKVDLEDVTSEAGSDVSNISSVASIQSISGDNYSIMNSKGSSSFGLELPDVHGHGRNRGLDAQVQMRKLNRKLDLLSSENENYAKLAKEIPDYKQELFQLKSANFDLQRENANLKSQLQSALSDQRKEEKVIEKVPTVTCDHSTLLYNSKAQLRQAHDEIFSLKTEVTKLKLDLRSRDDALKRHEATHEALENCNLELSADKIKLTGKVRELEVNLQSSQRSRMAAEQSLSVLQSERESFVKSKNWYRDQMHAAQDTRTEIQQELIRAQSELASKSTQVEKYKLELFQTNKLLEDEREKALQEKEELKRQLEELEVSIMANENVNSLDLSVDSGHDEDLDEDVKIQVEVLKDEVRGKEAKIEILQLKLEEAIKISEVAHTELEASRMKTERVEENIKELESNIALLNDQLQTNSVLIGDLKDSNVNCEMRNSKLKSDLHEAKQSLLQELDLSKALRNELKHIKETLEKKENDFEILEVELRLNRAENARLKTEMKSFKDVQQENILLKKQLLHQDSELLDENSSLKEAFAASDEARKELEAALDDLKKQNNMLKQVSNETMKENCQECDSVQLIMKAKSDALEGAEAKIIALEATIQELTTQAETLSARSESMKSIEARDEELDHDEDLHAIQAQKISRLECSLKIYQAEINRLTSKVFELEDQILTLEHKNGRLIMDSSQNFGLKSQIQKLQEEIAKDTALRQELLSSLELAKSSLYTELANLERNLQVEKEAHSETKNRLILQEHECSALRVDRRSLRTGLETANLTIDNLKSDKSSPEKPLISSSDDDLELCRELEVTRSQLKDALACLEDSKRSVSKLEDQASEVSFHLKQKTSELKSLQTVVKLRDESYHSEVSDLRSKCDNLRAEVVNLTRKVDRLSEEKNNYRAQVQDMNTALKTSLEQIKRLRSRPSSEDDHADWNDLLLSRKMAASNESLAQKQNLTNLHNCLATLKYEMAVLQRKLAPSAKNSPLRQQPSKPTIMEDAADIIEENTMVVIAHDIDEQVE